MLRFVLLITTLTAGLMACRTTNAGLGGGDAPYSLADDASAELSADAQCEFSGGEVIDGVCYCSDGTATFEIEGKAATCAQWIKQNYQACYGKGGTAKRNDTGHDCFCPHGETIDENGSQTCYQKFAAKNSQCASTKGIILADDRVCRCMHGKVAGPLQAAGTTCSADHKASNERCDSRGGLSRDGTTCECRDGTFIHKDENATCAEKWFFQDDSIATKPGTGNGPTNPGQGNGQVANSGATCKCQLYNNNLVLFKPSQDRKALQLFSLQQLGISAAEVNGGRCFDVFRDKIYEAVQPASDQGGCGGSWEFVATAETGGAGKTNFSSEVDPATMCVCKQFTGTFRETYRCGAFGRQLCTRNYNAQRCGVFKPNSNEYFISWSTQYGCNQDACTSLAGSSESLYRYCPKHNGKPMWRTE